MMYTKSSIGAAAAFALVLAAPASAQVIDGSATVAEYGPARAVQNNFTGFGNNISELDALFVTLTPTSLNIAITGNLEPNGNAISIYLDTANTTATNVLSVVGAPSAVQGQNGATFDTGFTPDYVLTLNNSGGTVFFDLFNIVTDTNNFLGSVAVNTIPGADNLGAGQRAAFNNTNILGVDDAADQDGSDAVTGLEVVLNTSSLGGSFASIGLSAFLTGGSGFGSNQVLPGLGGGQGNLGNGPNNFTLANAPGNQFVTVAAVPGPPAALVLLAGGLPLLRRRRK